MNARTASLVALVIAAGVPACDKAGSKGSASSAGEAQLWAHLPAGGTVVFGGNYLKLQRFMADSALGKMTQRMSDAVSKGMKEWMDCFIAIKGMNIVGSLGVVGAGGDLRMVMAGATLAQLNTCAGKAGFKASTDADGKFLSVEVPGPTGSVTQGYLQLADGALYTRQHVAMGGGAPAVTPSSRADVEADIAGLAKGSVATDQALQAVIAKPDHGKTMWFAGSAVGTPIADKLGEVYGSMDLDAGVAIDVTAQVLDKDLATKAEQGIASAKQSADKLPPELRSMVTGLELSRDGDRLHLKAKISDAQLQMVLKQAGLGG
jgi:hypothetical protein